MGTIVMYWNFPAGIQGPNHPSPGRKYQGSFKQAYVPNTFEGREALDLLIKAFIRGHLFSVATSYSAGGGPRVTFSSIHLKSRTHGGST